MNDFFDSVFVMGGRLSVLPMGRGTFSYEYEDPHDGGVVRSLGRLDALGVAQARSEFAKSHEWLHLPPLKISQK